MTTGMSFHSDEELVKRLQVAVRDHATAAGDHARHSNGVREVRTLASEIAERIYDEPEKWGIADMPPRFRDDAAADALLALLANVPDFHGRQAVSDWFGRTAESKFRRLWSTTEHQAREEQESAGGRVDGQGPEISAEAVKVFEEHQDAWQSFEGEFPRDAFALRLRYMLNREPEQMAVMLDAPNTRTIVTRINRARDRFRMFCEQRGVGRSKLADIMDQFAEEHVS